MPQTIGEVAVDCCGFKQQRIEEDAVEVTMTSGSWMSLHQHQDYGSIAYVDNTEPEDIDWLELSDEEPEIETEDDEFRYIPIPKQQATPCQRGKAYVPEVHRFRTLISREARDFLQEKYPALDTHNWWGLLEFLLFVDTRGLRRVGRFNAPVVAPRECVARAVGKNPTTHGFSSTRELAAFSQEVIQLRIEPHDFGKMKATVVTPVLPKDVKAVLENDQRLLAHYHLNELARKTRRKTKLKGEERRTTQLHPAPEFVCLVTGRKAIKKEIEQREVDNRKLLTPKSIASHHPAFPMVQLFKERCTGHKETQIYLTNLPILQQELAAVADDEPDAEKISSQVRRRNFANGIVAAMGGFAMPQYVDSEGSPRLFTVGPSPLKLPREYRDVAYNGMHEFDLAACQLAVVSKIWGIPGLHEKLGKGVNIWTELYADLGVDSSFKPALKQGIYSIVFGGSKRGIKAKMKDELKALGTNPRLAREVIRKFFENQVVQEVLKARKQEGQRMLRTNQAMDAFGEVRDLGKTYARLVEKEGGNDIGKIPGWRDEPKDKEQVKLKRQWTSRAIRSTMAYVVQSYELRLMLTLVPVIQRDRQIYPLGFLFDAIILDLGNKTREERNIRKLKKAVEEYAKNQDIPVRLEHEILKAQ